MRYAASPIRSMPRPLVNRNPAQNNREYAPGHDAMTWGMAHSLQ